MTGGRVSGAFSRMPAHSRSHTTIRQESRRYFDGWRGLLTIYLRNLRYGNEAKDHNQCSGSSLAQCSDVFPAARRLFRKIHEPRCLDLQLLASCYLRYRAEWPIRRRCLHGLPCGRGGGGSVVCCIKVKPGPIRIEYSLGGSEGMPRLGERIHATAVLTELPGNAKVLTVHVYPDGTAFAEASREYVDERPEPKGKRQ